MAMTVPCTIVIPVLNEEDNILPLVAELNRLREELGEFELLLVDDHSTDQTPATMQHLATLYPWFKGIRLAVQSGQSAALYYGILEARHPLIVTMDGDGQNDPADIPRLLATYTRAEPHSPYSLVAGCRAQRRDSRWRRFSSRIANGVRQRLLHDSTRDSGCGIKVFSRELFLSLPAFKHMHRFLPALVQQCGGTVVSVDVGHRERTSGRSHYGTLDRLLAGVIDLCGVLWLARRAIPMDLIEEAHQDVP
jgi:dolichol-phosphate mannosyltransferase